MKVGDRVRVITSINVYHHPEHRGQPFDINGIEGEVIQVLQDWHGRPISPNYPLAVKFGGKFKAHLGAHELEVVGS